MAKTNDDDWLLVQSNDVSQGRLGASARSIVLLLPGTMTTGSCRQPPPKRRPKRATRRRWYDGLDRACCRRMTTATTDNSDS